MKNLFSFTLLALSFLGHSQPDDESIIRSIYSTALQHNQGYEWLRELTEMGPRLAGSENATAAVRRFQKIADSLGFRTQLQEVTVPQWVPARQEKAHFSSKGKKTEVAVCALGGSVGTASAGLGARVVEVNSFEELDSLGDQVKGKIVFYNIPMDPTYINTFFAYSNAGKQRYVGALEASKYGAVASVSRSLSSTVNEYPHTGSMTYRGAVSKIPAAAISTTDAEKLSRALKADPELTFHLKMNCEWKDSVTSYNLIADLPGTGKPGEIILIGGHIDSWDLGTGAHDDGAGCIHSLESAWLLKELGLRPKRTLRVVFFMNEEFGLNGATEYARQARQTNVNHVIAIESDEGGFSPRGISMVAPDSVISEIKMFRELLEPYGIHEFSQTGAGADISKLYADDLVMIGLRPDSHRYFEVHHSARDILEEVNPRELEMGSATLAAVIYLLDKYNVTAK